MVLIDLQMKNIGGFNAARELLHEFPDAEIVFITDFEDELMLSTAKSIGVKTVIPKGLLYEFYDKVNIGKNDLPAWP